MRIAGQQTLLASLESVLSGLAILGLSVLGLAAVLVAISLIDHFRSGR